MPLDMLNLGGVTIEKRLTPSDVHVDRPLTNISVAYMQGLGNFGADAIFPRIGVQKQSDKYFTYDRSYWNRSEMRIRPPSTETPGGGMKVSLDTYFCEVYGLHMDVDDRVVANADSPLAPRIEAAEWVTYQGVLFREITWIDGFFAPSKWTNEKAGVNSGPTGTQFLRWNDAGSDPVKNVKDWKAEMHVRSGGFSPNTLVLSKLVYDALTENDSIIDRLKYGQTPGAPAMVTRQNLAQLFEIDNIVVLSAVRNTAVEGDTESNAFIAGKHAGLFYIAPRPGLRTPTAGYTFVWNGYPGAADGQRVSSFRMDNIRSDRVEIEMSFGHKKVSDDLGIFLNGAIA